MAAIIKDNMFEILLQVFNNTYPSIDCDIYFVSGLYEAELGYGVTEFDTAPVRISIDVSVPLLGILEVMAHELAHTVVGIDEDHGKEWEKVFDDLLDLFNEEMTKRIEANEL